MRIQTARTELVGSCNFCDKGKLSKSGCGLEYPYKEVYEIEARGISVRICLDCLKDMGLLINAIVLDNRPKISRSKNISQISSKDKNMNILEEKLNERKIIKT